MRILEIRRGGEAAANAGDRVARNRPIATMNRVLGYDGGAPQALLEERSDLDYETLKFYLRQGTFSMPPFRPTEVTDAEIADIAAYLKYSSTRSD